MSATRTPSAAQLAVAVRNLRQRSPDLEMAASEPLAVIGIGCRFSGGASDPESLWRLIGERRNVASVVPPDRFTADDLRGTRAEASFDICRGAFLDDIDRFDAHFFGVSPREAALMDPQQRMLLEVAWEAMDDAGIPPERLRATSTGVFAAMYNHDYLRYQYSDPEQVVAHTSSGTSPAIATGRIAFLLDLRGPAVIFDTACSSSLVATHFACASLRNRDCDLAIVGGAGLILGPETYVSLSKWGMLAPDGRCKTFDAQADGFGRAEGCGVLLVKRLADALRDGDRIRSVIRGTALNQDGRSTDLTAPNGLAQQDVIRRALRNAQVAPQDIGFIEAHGTGTPLGDPIEVEALAEVLGDTTPGALPCALSSVKANIGHLEAAAGVAGLIKATLVLEKAAIPPQALFESLNPHLSLEGTRFYVPTQAAPWPRGAVPRFAGVSSFGFSGTNAHVIMEEPPRLPAAARSAAPATQLLVLSARDETSLVQVAARHAAHLAQTEDALADVCYTAAVRRAHYEHRVAVVGDDAGQMVERLEAFVRGERLTGVASGLRRRGTAVQPVFVFSGQGPQWPRMGMELYATEPVFRRALDDCDAALRRHSTLRLLDELGMAEGESRMASTEIAQPAIFALQTALAALWKSWGIVPAAVVGHSIGEVAAAHVAGILTLDDAARLVVQRGRLMQQATGSGRMAQVELPAEEVAQWLAPRAAEISVAAINTPGSCVVSGTAAAVEAVLAEVTARGAQWTRLPVDYAFHSPQMEPYGLELEALLQGLAPARGDVPLISTVTAGPIAGATMGGAYWRRNLREPVRFAAAIAAALADGHRLFLEVAPHPVLSQSVQRCGAAGDAPTLCASLRRAQPQRAAMLQGLAGLFAAGMEPDWRAVFPEGGRVVSLPRYAWKDERYPVPRYRDQARRRERVQGDARQPALGARVPLAAGPVVHELRVSLQEQAYLRDHCFAGQAVLPAAFYVEAVLELGRSLWGDVPCQLEAIAFDQPLLLADDAAPLLQVTADSVDARRVAFRISSLAPGAADWVVHAGGQLALTAAPPLASMPDAAQVVARCATVHARDALYAELATIGPEFGPSFRAIERLFTGPGEAWAEIRATAAVEAGAAGMRFHPALLDACFQSVAGALGALGHGAAGKVYVPVGIDRITFCAPPSGVLHVQATASHSAAGAATVDLRAWDADGRLVLFVEGFRARAVPRAALVQPGGATASEDALRELAWREVALAAGPARRGSWLVIDDGGDTGAALVRALGAAGVAARCMAADDAFAPAGDCVGVVLLATRGARNVDAATGAQIQSQAVELCRLASRVAVAALRTAPAPRLVVVTAGAQHAGDGAAAALAIAQAALWGWHHAVALEHPELRPLAIDIDPDGRPDDVAALAAELLADDVEDRVVLRQDSRRVARLVRADLARNAAGRQSQATPVRLEIERRGTLDALAIRPALRRAPGPGEVEIRVQAAGLNFRDVMNALGTYPGDPGPLGDECAGVVVATGPGVRHLQVGDPVMAFMPGCFASYATGLATMVVRRPSNLSPEQAAGVPVVFMTAAMALERIAKLRAGQRVLIHAAAGGVGLAAVELALRAGVEVFATAGSEAKRQYLAALGVQHVMDSRTLAFSQQVLDLTGGEGVDAVLNSLAGDFIAASFAVVRRGGHFLEIGKTGIWTPQQVAALGRDIQYAVIFLGEDRERRPELLAGLMQELADRLERGELRMPAVRAFPLERASEAMRFMAQARHIGKLVVRMPGGQPLELRADSTYLVSGGLGGLGLVAAATLADGGARQLLLLGRKAPDEAAQAAIGALESAGCNVRCIACDIADPEAVPQLLAALATLPPLRGIVHAAGVVDDGPLETLDATRWDAVMAPKVAGTWNLHRLAQSQPVDFFVCYSAGATLLGSAGQSNYAAANAVMDALVEYRRRAGLPALGIHLGAWSDAGMAARLDARGRERWQSKGMEFISPQAGGRYLRELLGWAASTVAVLPARWADYAASIPASARSLVSEIDGSRDAGPARAQATVRSLQDSLEGVPVRRRREALAERLVELSRRVLGVGSSFELPLDQPLRDLGLDSLMAVELRNAIGGAAGRNLPATLLFDYPSVDALAGHLLATLGLGEAAASAEPAPDAGAVQRAQAEKTLAGMSESEAEALLLAELGETGSGDVR